jgi:hypothetical protein
VQQNPRFALPDVYNERRKVPPGSCPRVARRLQPTRPEPAVYEVNGGLRGSGRVRPVAYQLLRESEYLCILSYYRQKILRFRDANESRLFYRL